jgi:hypothetical protein
MAEGIGTIYDYDELVKVILSTLHRPDLEPKAAGWIAATELELYRDCDVRPGDQILSGTFVGGETQLALPYGCHRPIKLELKDGDNARWTPRLVSLDQLGVYLDDYDDGLPRAVAVFGDAIQIAPTPKAGLTYRLFYHGLPLPLSRTNKTSRLFEMGWDAYLYGALTLTAPHIGDDERLPVWGSLYGLKKASLKRAVWRARTGAGLLTSKPDFRVSDQHVEE